MIKVEPYECYKEYLAIKRHFTSPSYDYFKYDGRIRTSKVTSSKRKDNFLFTKLAKTYKDEEIKTFFVANFVDNENFWITDTFKFAIDTVESVLVDNVEADIKDIRVVPNPYVGTNAMEEAVINPFLNQPRKIMFTNLPSSCVISIFTPSGVKVKTINKNDGIDNGMVYWDLLNEEGLEIAAGMYLYHVKPNFLDPENKRLLS